MITKIRKRNGFIVKFEKEKIFNAIFKALTTTNGDKKKTKEITNKVVELLNIRYRKDEIPKVEEIQDIIEEVLILENLVKAAKAFILYREQRRKIREEVETFDESINAIDKYLDETTWEVKENANMTYSLQGLRYFVMSEATKKYWLDKIYPKEIRDSVKNTDMHIHDLQELNPYCCGWDLQDFLLKGFGGVPGKIQSTPPKHFRTALGQLVNLFYTLQGECYSSNTQVLTDSGWKYFWEVKEDNKVFTLNNQTNEIELQKPIRFYEFNYNGELYNFKSRKLDLLVTPNHNMVVDQYCPNCKERYHRKFIKAKNFNPNIHFIPKQTIWGGRKEEFFILPEIEIQQYSGFAKKYRKLKIKSKKILMTDWLPFFGFWLAEGSTTLRKRNRKGREKSYYEYQVRIFQNKGKKADEFEEILKRLPFYYIKKIFGNKLEFLICDKQLFSYLRQFGKAGDKFVPNEIKNLEKNQLITLTNWMMKGDGYIGNGNIEYYTKSRKLADDFQELILKLGFTANIYEKSKENFHWYEVCNSRARHFRLRNRERNIKKISYQGKVYCLEVPNHTLYVRRNNKAVWCGNSAGAQAVSNFDTLLAPFIRYDNLNYVQVKQAIQEFLFNCMVPTRTGFQTPFLNVSLDIKIPQYLKDEPVIIGGRRQEETYGEFQDEVNIFIKAFYEVIMEGDASGRPFSFPIPTISIGKDFDWDNKILDPMWEATAKYGINYFSNFINSDMKPEDFRSMCCRLKINNTELRKRGGGLFGSSPLTGSLGIVTISMPRIGYLSKTKKEFYNRLGKLMDLASESLEIKRKTVEVFMEKGLYPYSRYYLSNVKKIRGSYLGNHFSTIGLLGMNEALLNFMKEDIGSKNGKKLALEVLDFMNNKLLEYQKKTGNLYNLEATPGEGITARFVKADKEKYPDIITAGTAEFPYYSNSTQLPVNYTDDLFQALELQDDLQVKYTGGCVHHIFLGERLNSPEIAKNLIKKVFENFHLPYLTITPTFSICSNHGYLSGEYFECPKCIIKQPCEVYSRIVGYLRPVQQWNEIKRAEFKDRKKFKIN